MHAIFGEDPRQGLRCPVFIEFSSVSRQQNQTTMTTSVPSTKRDGKRCVTSSQHGSPKKIWNPYFDNRSLPVNRLNCYRAVLNFSKQKPIGLPKGLKKVFEFVAHGDLLDSKIRRIILIEITERIRE